jgi:hypothetical protein
MIKTTHERILDFPLVAIVPEAERLGAKSFWEGSRLSSFERRTPTQPSGIPGVLRNVV